jgi:NAD(P)-dependent dehydrogenase (short-subunit alcohol dehydrogenase family)
VTKAIFEKLFNLKGKVAFVTGGYRGIGQVFSETYAQAGADVVLVARNLEGCTSVAESISNEFGVKAIGKALDVRDSKMVECVVQETIADFGKIDILVNCAGISGVAKPVLEMSDKEMDEVMSVNFRGVFFVSRAVAKQMEKQKSGRIINVASMGAKLAARNVAGYCASKAAVVQLSRVMALELARNNIQVNAICPGYFITDLNRNFLESETGRKILNKDVPIHRAGYLEELQSSALYLASCPAFLTGAELYIDGGQSIR